MPTGLQKALAVFLIFLFAQIAYATVSDGVNWLTTQTNPDGSYARDTDIATSYQATAETLRALAAHEAAPNALALDYLGITTFHSAEYLSRRIIALADSGEAVDTLINELLLNQNLDGGFGAFPGYESETLDTAYALEALALANQRNHSSAGRALTYLINQQNQVSTDPEEGSWRLDNNTPSLYLTAYASSVIQQYRYVFQLNEFIDDANNYLLSQQATSGAIGELFETAMVLNAVAPATADTTSYAATQAYLENAQTAPGSWEDDVYTTALALRAIRSTEVPPPIQGSNTATFQGVVYDSQTRTPIEGVSVNVFNSGETVTVSTNALGEYRATGIQLGSITFSFTKSGYLEHRSSGTALAAVILEYSPELVIQIVASDTASVAGKVTISGNGGALQNVSITATSSGQTRSTNTDATGSYIINGIMPGAITLSASLQGYITVSGGGSVAAGQTVNFSPAMTSEDVVEDITLSGTVVSASDNSPITGATITVLNTALSTQSLANGQFTLTGIVAGTVNVQVSHTGYFTNTYRINVPEGGPFDIGEIRLNADNTTPQELKPDLVVSAFTRDSVTTDLQTLQVSGLTTVSLSNKGLAESMIPATVTVFEDTNNNAVFDSNTDNILGVDVVASLAVNASAEIQIPLYGTVAFRDSPIYVMVDSEQQIDEERESNNTTSTLKTCRVEPGAGLFEPVLKWSWTGSTTLPGYDQVESIPIVVPLEDTNSDGKFDEQDIPSIVFSTYPAVLYGESGPSVLRAISGLDGHELWSVVNPDYRVYGLGNIAAADIDNDGAIEIVATTSPGFHNASGIIAFEHTGEMKWRNTQVTGTKWGGISIADLNQDGSAEIIIGNAVLKGDDGSLLWRGTGYSGTQNSNSGPLSIVADIDLDGSPEVLAGAAAYSSTGALIWQNTAVGDGYDAVGNFDADDFAEIVVVSNGRVTVLEHDGEIKWGPVSIPGGGNGGPPTVADMDGDGEPEIGVAGANSYAVFDTNGQLIWSSPTRDTSSHVTGSSVFDFDGDGQAEVIYADELKLRVYNGKDGTILYETPRTSGTGFEYPLIVDIDNDHHAELIVPSESYSFGGDTGIYVYEGKNDDWMDTRRIWNQHSYHITNINDDGSVPINEQPSWLTHNTYRLNTFADRDPGLLSDLTASQLQINGNVLTARIGNAGATAIDQPVTVGFYNGDPDAGGSSIGSVVIDSLAGGSYRDITLNDSSALTGVGEVFVVADTGAVISECDETNNRMSITCDIAPQIVKPDFTITSFLMDGASTDLFSLEITGNASVTISNIGADDTSAANRVVVFEDMNNNGVFDNAIDNILGDANVVQGLSSGQENNLIIPVSGTVAFRDSPVYAMVDSDLGIDESNENNNTNTSSKQCKVTPDSAAFEPVLKWSWSGSSVQPSYNQVMMAPIVVPLEDTNNDGLFDDNDTPSVVFSTFSSWGGYGYGGYLRAVSGVDGHELWTAQDQVHSTGGLAAGDIDGDGAIEIIAVRPGSSWENTSGLMVFEHTGDLKWQNTVVTGIAWGSASVADIDGNGTPEIIIGNSVVNADGTLRWKGDGYTGGVLNRSLSVVADIDLDGKQEVVAGAAAYSSEGVLLWQNTTAGDGFDGVGNFDNDDFAEIVVVSNGRVSLLEHTGEMIWGPVGIPGGGRGGPPTIADVDGDGDLEIGVAGANFYTVFDTDGSVLWSSRTQDASSQVTGSSVFDFDGDGKVEIVYSDELKLRVYNGTDGVILFETPNPSGTLVELPVIADIDNDNHAEIVVASNNYYIAGTTGIQVYEDINDAWVDTRSIWNQHSYHITNINDDGSIPANEQPSWLTHNTYRLNTFADRDPSLASDITLSRLRIYNDAAGQVSSIQVRVGNGGQTVLPDTVKVNFYQGDPADGGVLLGSIDVPALGGGTHTDVSLTQLPTLNSEDIYVVADPDNQYAECREDNNSVSSPLQQIPVLGAIQVATDASAYAHDTPALLQATVTNTQTTMGSFSAKLQITDLEGNLVVAFPAQSTGNLAANASITKSQPWNIGNTLSGLYQLHGMLYDERNRLIDMSTTTFQIAQPDTAIGIRTTTDKPVYHTSDSVVINDLIRNLTTNSIIREASLKITVSDIQGSVIFTETQALEELSPGALRDLPSTFNLNDAAEGIYAVQGNILNANGEVLATDQAQFEVLADPQKELTGKVIAQSKILQRGQTQVCTDTLTYTGSQILTAQPIRQLLVNLDTAELITSSDSTITMQPDATESLIRSVASNNLSEGAYSCVLQAQIAGEWMALADDNFSVTVPPIDIDATLEQGDELRLLVLLDGIKQCGGEDDDSDSDSDSDDDSDADSDEDGDFDGDHDCGASTDTDPHGPSNAPLLSEQRSYLEDIFNTQGWSYTIVTDKDAFADELRSGTYNAYALLSEQVKLAKQVQEELREAVFRGEGLLIAGDHDHRNSKLDDVIGVKVKGKLPAPDAISIDSIENYLAGTADFSLIEKARRIELREAEAVAAYPVSSTCGDDDDGDSDSDSDSDSEDDDSDSDSDDDSDGNHSCNGTTVAVAHNNYGYGHSVYAGFDLLAQAALSGADPLFTELLIDALEDIKPETSTLLTGSVVPVKLALTNQGIATPGQAVITLPVNSQIIDAGSATTQPDGSLLWVFDLAENATETLTFWLQLPDMAGPANTEALLQVGITPNLADHDTLLLTLNLNQSPSLTEVRDELSALKSQHKHYKKAHKKVEKALKYQNQGKYEKALKEALKAADYLSDLDYPDAKAVHRKLALAIRELAGQLP